MNNIILKKLMNKTCFKRSILILGISFIIGLSLLIIWEIFVIQERVLSNEIIFRSKLRNYDTTGIPGKIFFRDENGYLISLRPTNCKVETVFTIDTMEIVSMSYDAKNILLLYEVRNDTICRFNNGEVKNGTVCRLFKFDLENSNLSFIYEATIIFPDFFCPGFTRDNDKIYFGVFEKGDIKTIVIDYSGNIMQLPWWSGPLDPSGKVFWHRSKRNMNLELYNLEEGTISVLDRNIIPQNAWPLFLLNSNIVTMIENENMVFFVPFNELKFSNGKVDTLFYKSNCKSVYIYPDLRIVVQDGKVLLILSGEYYDKVSIYDNENFLWETYGPNIIDGLLMFSPDGKNMLVFDYDLDSISEKKLSYTFYIIGNKGKTQKIPIPSCAKILGWFDEKGGETISWF